MKNILQAPKIYLNLYQITPSKDLLVHQYPFSVTSEIEAGDSRMRKILFKGWPTFEINI